MSIALIVCGCVFASVTVVVYGGYRRIVADHKHQEMMAQLEIDSREQNFQHQKEMLQLKGSK